MPPTPKHKKMMSLSLKKSRALKKRKAMIAARQSKEPQDLTNLLNLSHDALNTSNETVDPEFDLETSMKSDSGYLAEEFCEEWLTQLLWEDRTALGLFLVFQLQSILKKKRTEAAELAGMMIGKSTNTMLTWIQSFFENEGTIKDHRQGHYQRSGVLWRCESLSSKAAKYIRENAADKGRSNLTCFSFCEWVNEDLLQNSTLEPGRIS